MPLFLLGFLPKGSQQLACQLLNCLFATDIKGINYLFIKILLLLFLIVLGFNLTTLHIYHYHHYTFLAFDSTCQVLDSGYMNIYQLPVQVHNIQLLALESLAASFSFLGVYFS